MTDRLYYTNAYVREFEARVISSEPFEKEGLTRVRLDRTAFYPTSGGQPHDRGTIGGHQVVDVIDEDETIAHLIDGHIESGRDARGTIDWNRRFDHMQQHTGQHILSAALDHGQAAPTISFHLGGESSTIDTACALSAAQIASAEDVANRVVWENRPVIVRSATAQEAASLSLRKEPARTGILRLIEVQAFDLSACGGTHVANTGEVGTVAVLGSERFKGGTRIEFVCGRRALASHQKLRDIVSASVRAFSVLPEELQAAVTRLQAEHRDLRRQAKALREELARYEARELVADAVQLPDGTRLVTMSLDQNDPGLMKMLASAAAREPGCVVVLTGQTSPTLLVVARSTGVPLDAAAVVGQVAARFNGRGGGRPELAQAGGLQEHPNVILSEARTLIMRSLGTGDAAEARS